MYYKRLLLALGAILIVVIFFKTSLYGDWYNTRLATFEDQFPEESGNLDYEARRAYRWQGPYDLAKFIKKTVGADSNELIIIPTAAYIKKVDPKLMMPEAITLYYYTGLKAVYPQNKKADSAKFGIFIQSGNVKVARINDTESMKMLKEHYAKHTAQ